MNSRFKWTLHHMFGHPMSEVLFQLGLVRASEWIHDATLPQGIP